jgi:hypothetical protein
MRASSNLAQSPRPGARARGTRSNIRRFWARLKGIEHARGKGP